MHVQGRHHGGRLFTVSVLIACSAHFLLRLRMPCPGMVLLTAGWVLSCQSIIKKMLHRLVYRPIGWRSFFS